MASRDSESDAPGNQPSDAGRPEGELPELDLNWQALGGGMALVGGVVLALYSALSLIVEGVDIPGIWLLVEGVLFVVLGYIVLRESARRAAATHDVAALRDERPALMGDMVCAECGADFGTGSECPECGSRSRLRRETYERLKA